jgi:hypothetical protein
LRQLATVATALSIVAAASCTTGRDATPEAPASSAPPAISAPAETQVAAAEEAALDAYRGMWSAYVEAIGIPDPEHPLLARFAAGDALRVLVDGLESVQRDGLAGRGEVALDPAVTELSPAETPTSASIVDCVDTSGGELYRVDGEPFEDTPGGRRRAEATVRDVGDGEWKVVGFALYEVGSCAR